MKMESIKMKSGRIVVALVLALCGLLNLTGTSFADFSNGAVGTAGAQFLKLPVGARAIGMGSAYTAIADDANAIYYNVAGIAFSEKKSAEYMFSQYVANTNYHWAAFAMPISESLGSAGIGFQYFNAGNIDRTDITSAGLGTFNPSDLAVNFSYAHKILGPTEAVGINLKVINSKIDTTATTAAVDFGVQSRRFMDGKMMLGFAVQNLGGSLTYENTSSNLPILIKLGSGYKIQDNWITSLDVVFPQDNDPYAAVGTEYSYKIQDGMSIAGRFGYNSETRYVTGFNGITVGLGLQFNMFSLDYAWMPLGDLGMTNRISLGMKF